MQKKRRRMRYPGSALGLKRGQIGRDLKSLARASFVFGRETSKVARSGIQKGRQTAQKMKSNKERTGSFFKESVYK
jgi:hypothetical protein